MKQVEETDIVDMLEGNKDQILETPDKTDNGAEESPFQKIEQALKDLK